MTAAPATPTIDPLADYVAGLTLRTMREGGFTGTVAVANVESTGPRAWSADAVATVGEESVPYAVRIADGRVTITRV